MSDFARQDCVLLANIPGGPSGSRLPVRPKLTWSKTSEQIRPWAAMRRVQADEIVAAVTCDLLVGWHTVMRTIIGYGQPLVDETRQRIQQDTRGHRGRFTPTRYAKRGRYYRADVALASTMIWVAS